LNVAGATYGQRQREEKEKKLEAMRRRQELEYQYDLQRRNQLDLERTRQLFEGVKDEAEKKKIHLKDVWSNIDKRLDVLKSAQIEGEFNPEDFQSLQSFLSDIGEARTANQEIDIDTIRDLYNPIGKFEQILASSRASEIAEKKKRDAEMEERRIVAAERQADAEERRIAQEIEENKLYEWEGRKYKRNEFYDEVYKIIKSKLDKLTDPKHAPMTGDEEEIDKLKRDLEKASDLLFGEKPKDITTPTRKFIEDLASNLSKLKAYRRGDYDFNILEKKGVDTKRVDIYFKIKR